MGKGKGKEIRRGMGKGIVKRIGKNIGKCIVMGFTIFIFSSNLH